MLQETDKKFTLYELVADSVTEFLGRPKVIALRFL